MAPLTPRNLGFTADVHVRTVPPRTRTRLMRALALVTVTAALVLGFAMTSEADEGSASEASNSQQSVATPEYVWRVYMLNQTGMTDASNGTAFSFETEDLPRDFSSILFGDFRADPTGQGTYYGGCGILVKATGVGATFVLREMDGKFISSVSYNGQDPVVFSGERRSVSYPSATTCCYGTDLMVQDWRNGTWSPEAGILVEHPNDVTMIASEFFLMLFEPEGQVGIPEFSDFTVVTILAVGTATVIVRKSRAEGQ